jgi:hypothetical protein
MVKIFFYGFLQTLFPATRENNSWKTSRHYANGVIYEMCVFLICSSLEKYLKPCIIGTEIWIKLIRFLFTSLHLKYQPFHHRGIPPSYTHVHIIILAFEFLSMLYFASIHLIPDFLYQQILLFLKSDSFTKYEFIRSKYTNEVVHLIDVL